jgi:hypothetical protein
MATERFVSPGVFTRENDLTFLPQGIAEIGGAFVGPTVKGQAFVPTIVESGDEFKKIFGDPIPQYYIGHAAINYLADAARATIVRVLGLDGYDEDDSNAVVLTIASGSGPDEQYPVAVLFPARNTQDVTPLAFSSVATGTLSGSRNFELTLTNSNGEVSTLTGLSLESTDAGYFADALGGGPASPEVGYVILNFPRGLSGFSQSADEPGSFVNVISGSAAADVLNFSGSAYGAYSNAATPWIQSQTVGGKRHNLFKVHTFADGNEANKSIKVSITNTRPAASTADDQHGKFTLLVREYSDTDNKLSILEQFDNLSIDPESPDYFARRIGDQYWTVDAATNDLTLNGDFANNSDYVYVEIAAGLENLPDTALPAGFAALNEPADFGAVELGTEFAAACSASYITTRFAVPTGGSEAVENVRIYYGFDFVDETNKAYPNPLPSGSTAVGSAFSLENLTGDDADVSQSIVSGTVADGSLRKFTVPFQGGFDGLNPSRVLAVGNDIAANNTQGFNLQLSTSPGSKAYKQAIDILSNDEAWDINMLVIPGILRQYHSYITQQAIDMCEARGDCFYIMDGFAFNSTVNSAVNTVSALDSSYAGVYHPWIKIFDAVSNKNIWVPPSTVMAGVYAFNDKVAAEWFAPAGLNRGGIDEAVQVEKRLTRANRDDLYDGRVNPIALFPGQGIVAYGQKTLQVKSSALDRINVRRLLIAVKKFIASASRFVVFEQNDESTRQRFLSIVNPYLASVQERNGLFAFKVIMDESNNPPDIIDRNILVGDIYLQPTRTAEFISLTFNILPTGATFPEGA